MKDLVLMDINCKDARSFRLVTGKLFLCIKVIIIVRFLQRIKPFCIGFLCNRHEEKYVFMIPCLSCNNYL